MNKPPRAGSTGPEQVCGVWAPRMPMTRQMAIYLLLRYNVAIIPDDSEAPAQPTFSDLEASSGRVTRRRRFLALLDSKIPWGAWTARVEPHYPKAGGGRPPVPLGTILRMYVVQALLPTDGSLAGTKPVQPASQTP